MTNRYYFYLTEAYLEDHNLSRDGQVSTWKALARRSEHIYLGNVRTSYGGVGYTEMEVKLCGWGINARGNLELFTTAGFVIEILEEALPEAVHS